MQFNIPTEYKNASGVYIIRNSVNDKVYIGSTKRFRERFRIHRRDFLHRKHHAIHFQRFVDKYGLDTLSFELLETCQLDRLALLACEQKWLDKLSAFDKKKGYNILCTAGSRLGHKGKAWTDEQREAIRKRQTGRIKTPEECLNISRALKGGPGPSEEARRKIAASLKGRKVPPESLAKRPKSHTVEHKIKIGEAGKRIFTEMGAAHPLHGGKHLNAEVIQRRATTLRKTLRDKTSRAAVYTETRVADGDVVRVQHFCAKCNSGCIRRDGAHQGHAKYKCNACGYKARFVPAAQAKARPYAQVEKLLAEGNTQLSVVRATGAPRRMVAELAKKVRIPCPLAAGGLQF